MMLLGYIDHHLYCYLVLIPVTLSLSLCFLFSCAPPQSPRLCLMHQPVHMPSQIRGSLETNVRRLEESFFYPHLLKLRKLLLSLLDQKDQRHRSRRQLCG
ncbi:hypothetical protein BS78_03G257200 [Paspalum vaginatum]|nr:hypothetical protein BS78_03G257200 [Paspalum vaginatum]